ncbi:MAG: hypothetical protein KME13_22215 [Myxacorys californica WJT36-NPBG1]|jgi:hypothetical protein|nr:hypothetical protein [Myxacorys californica WJT36-NPBG1]
MSQRNVGNYEDRDKFPLSLDEWLEERYGILSDAIQINGVNSVPDENQGRQTKVWSLLTTRPLLMWVCTGCAIAGFSVGGLLYLYEISQR